MEVILIEINNNIEFMELQKRLFAELYIWSYDNTFSTELYTFDELAITTNKRVVGITICPKLKTMSIFFEHKWDTKKYAEQYELTHKTFDEYMGRTKHIITEADLDEIMDL